MKKERPPIDLNDNHFGVTVFQRKGKLLILRCVDRKLM